MRTCSQCGAQIDPHASYCQYCGNLISFNDNLKIDLDLSEKWYCMYGTKQVGPLSIDEVEQAVKLNYIHRATPVWCSGMKDWLPAGMTRLSRFTGEYMTPVHEEPPEFPSSKKNSESKDHKLTNFGSWLIILLPVIVYLILDSNPCFASYPRLIWTMVIFTVWFLVVVDQIILSRAGYRTRAMILWGFIFPPIYFYKRSKMLDIMQTPFLVMLIVMILTFIFLLFYFTFTAGGNGVGVFK